MTKHEIITEYHKFFKHEALGARTQVADFTMLRAAVLATARAHYHSGITSAEVRDHMVADGFVVSTARVSSAWWSLLDSGEIAGVFGKTTLKEG